MPYNTKTQAKEKMSIDLFEYSQKPTDVYHYTTSRWDWLDCNVNEMWIEEVGKCQYVAVAYNPRKDKAVVVSEPRGYYSTLEWVRSWCCSFCILPY